MDDEQLSVSLVTVSKRMQLCILIGRRTNAEIKNVIQNRALKWEKQWTIGYRPCVCVWWSHLITKPFFCCYPASMPCLSLCFALFLNMKQWGQKESLWVINVCLIDHLSKLQCSGWSFKVKEKSTRDWRGRKPLCTTKVPDGHQQQQLQESLFLQTPRAEAALWPQKRGWSCRETDPSTLTTSALVRRHRRP